MALMSSVNIDESSIDTMLHILDTKNKMQPLSSSKKEKPNKHKTWNFQMGFICMG